MNVKSIVDKLYASKWEDKLVPVSQHKYKQQTLRTKVEIANLYLELYHIKQALEQADIPMHDLNGREEEVEQMVFEDELAFETDLEKIKYDRREKAFAEQSTIEVIRRLLSGHPEDPYDPDEPLEEDVKAYDPKNNKQTRRQYMAGLARKEKEKADKIRTKKTRKETKEAKRKSEKEIVQKTIDAYESQKEQEIDAILDSVRKKGGFAHATPKEMSDLNSVIEEVEAHLS